MSHLPGFARCVVRIRRGKVFCSARKPGAMKANALIIEDDPLMSNALADMMSAWGLTVEQALTGEEGLTRIAAGGIDFVLSDVVMPGLSGSEVLKECRKAHAEVPVILITGHASVKAATEAMHQGAFYYVAKPFEEDDLKPIVKSVLRHREKQALCAESGIEAEDDESPQLITESRAMTKVVDVIKRVARTDSTVLITGETGTGKEVAAHTIHKLSKRSAQPFVAFNCASLSANLLESELFGHAKGAFTGAIKPRRGRFEEAQGGTIFLDEISETTNSFQASLLRVLQEREIQRVGDTRKIPIDVRVLASSNQNLETLVGESRFRLDLFYRLRVVPIQMPPLRERGRDILLLAEHFAARHTRRYGGPPRKISPKAQAFFMEQAWRGNVRELQHCVERALVLTDRETLEPGDFTLDAAATPKDEGPIRSYNLNDVVANRRAGHLFEVLESTNWHRKEAAAILGIDRTTLYRLLKKYKIKAQDPDD